MERIRSYLLTCNAPTSGQLNCLPLLCCRQRHEHVDEIRAQHSKMDSCVNAIRCSGTELFDVLRWFRPSNPSREHNPNRSGKSSAKTNRNSKCNELNASKEHRKKNQIKLNAEWDATIRCASLTSAFCFHILNVRIWKLANCSSLTMPMWMSPYTSVLSSAGGQYCMHITCVRGRAENTLPNRVETTDNESNEENSWVLILWISSMMNKNLQRTKMSNSRCKVWSWISYVYLISQQSNAISWFICAFAEIHSIARSSSEFMWNISSSFLFSCSGKSVLSTKYSRWSKAHTHTLSLCCSLYLFQQHSTVPHSFSRAHTPCQKFKVLNEIPEVKPYQNLLKVKTCGIFSISHETLCKSEHWERAHFCVIFFLYFGFETNVSIRNVGEKTQREANDRARAEEPFQRLTSHFFARLFFPLVLRFSFIRKVSYASCDIELTYWMNSTVDWEKYTLVASTSCSKSRCRSAERERESIQHQIKLFTSFNLVNYDRHSFSSWIDTLPRQPQHPSKLQLHFMLLSYLCEIECFC